MPAAKKTPDPFALDCVALLQQFGEAHGRFMFGAYGLFIGGSMCGVVEDGVFYGKAVPETQAFWEAEGCQQFTYMAGEEEMKLGYWSVPEGALASASAFQPFFIQIQEAVRIQLAKKQPKGRSSKQANV